MPITKSAQKAWRQSIKRRAKNADQKESLRNILKKARALVAQKKIGEAKKILPDAYKALDKAVKAGLIKKNTASRTKSRLAKSLK